MRSAHPIEREVGMEYYASDVRESEALASRSETRRVSDDADGIGGRIRERAADFRVREIEAFDSQPVEADPDAYPHLVVRATLSGWDTNDFAARLSDALGISRERISWAGTKDKRAVTTQLVTVSKVEPADLPAIEGADLAVVGRAGRAIAFGDLAGNAFEIVVRDPEAPERAGAITDRLREFGGGRVGVPNYFGQQRFGSLRPVTHRVGLEIARGDLRGAVMAYLGNPRAAEPEDTQNAREYIQETEDWQGALDRFPRRLGYERAMLHRLVETGANGEDDFRVALEAVPANLQRLFVNAAQSYVFNRIISERLDRGLPFDRAVAGDVVCFAETDAPEDLARPDPDRTQRVTEDRVETIDRHVERGRAFVTAPLVGTETDLADGEPGEIERSVLADLDLAPADFDLSGEFHSTGTRRAILLTTDLTIERDPLAFSFSLPSGAYATVLLREYLKGDPRDLG